MHLLLGVEAVRGEQPVVAHAQILPQVVRLKTAFL